MQKNSILLGDCLELMKYIPDKSIDMILCDLPYGTTACKWDIIIPLEPLWKQYKRIIKDNGAIVLTASQPFTSKLVMSNIDMFKYEWIWVKNRGSNFATTKYMPMKEHENILVFGKNKLTYNMQMQERAEGGKSRIKYNFNPTNKPVEIYGGLKPKCNQKTDLRVPSSVQKFNTEVGLHPTQKPVALFEYLIKTYTNENDLVLDNAAGSGTTAIACINTNRNYILIEKDENYFNIINKRIGEMNGNK